MSYAWPAAFAFTAFCAAVTAVNVYTPPPPKSAQVVCIEQRGKWTGNGWVPQLGTCEFQCKDAKP